MRVFRKEAPATPVPGLAESVIVRRTLIGAALAFVALFLLLPLAAVDSDSLATHI